MSETKQKVFVSIPMHGRKDEELKEAIHGVMKYFPDGELIDQMLPNTGNRVEMLGRSIGLMSKADIVVLMPGWSNSPGCRAEYMVCKEYGIKTVSYDSINIQHYMKGFNASSITYDELIDTGKDVESIVHCKIDNDDDDPNNRQPRNRLIASFNTPTDVHNFCNCFSHENKYSHGSVKLACGDRIYINDDKYKKEWVIVGFDCENESISSSGQSYDNGYGIMLMPAHPLSRFSWNSTGKDSGYLKSDVNYFISHSVSDHLKMLLGRHLINRNVMLSNFTNDSGSISAIWTKQYATLMSTCQLNGRVNSHLNKFDCGEANYQLPLFKFKNTNIENGSAFWLRNVNNRDNAYCVDSNGAIQFFDVTCTFGVRPLIMIR